MTAEVLIKILQWSTLINIVLLALWIVAWMVARDAIYRIHGKMFKMSREQFDAIHYGGMAFHKICIIVFHLTPLLALYIARS